MLPSEPCPSYNTSCIQLDENDENARTFTVPKTPKECSGEGESSNKH